MLHGGPGSGATPWWRQFFDPDRYRLVLLDQRGCGRSLPNAIHWLTHIMGDVYPHEFDQLTSLLPANERTGNIPAAINALLMSDDPEVCDYAARAWCAWEDRLATLAGPVQPHPRSAEARRLLGFARLVTHYFGNQAFLADDAITGRLDRLEGIPTYLLRGRLDITSPLRSAYQVAQGIPHATFDIVEADAHAAGDDTVERLINVLDTFARDC